MHFPRVYAVSEALVRHQPEWTSGRRIHSCILRTPDILIIIQVYFFQPPFLCRLHLSLSLSLFLCLCRSLALFLFSGILVCSYLSGLLDIRVSLRESVFAIARVDSRSPSVSSLSPKFLASTIDARCSRRLVEGEKRSGR